jgi:hypothetical protein
MKTAILTATLRRSIPVVAALAMAAIVSPAHADNLVMDGDFSTVTVNNVVTPNVSSELGSSTKVVGWTSTGYNFVYANATVATTTGASGVALWTVTPPPDGAGTFLALDGGFDVGPVSQVINNLVIGTTYTLSFDFGGAQQNNRNGATTEQLDVSFGGSEFDTPVLNDASHGFTGWQTETTTFVATSTSETLSFLAVGTPAGIPPMSLLSNVSLTSTPEPSSLALLATGLFGVSGLVRSRLKKIVA